MKNTFKVLGIAVIIAVIGFASISLTGCDDGSGNDGVNPTEQTPRTADYNIVNMAQMAGSLTEVTITPKSGKSSGEITIYYEGTGGTMYAKSTNAPATAAAGSAYAVTFDVGSASGWKAATGLSAGTLKIYNPADLSFNTVTDFETFLSDVSVNTKDTPYTIKLNITKTSDFTTLQSAFEGNPNKYVYLDLSGSAITTIPSNAFVSTSNYFFTNTTLTGIILPNNITSIGFRAFYKCAGLTSITIPNNVTSIGAGAFAGCTSLASVTFTPTSKVTAIGENVFTDCSSLASITIPNSVTSIGAGAFSGCTSLASAIIGNNVTSIERGAFQNCTSLTSITIPNSVTSIGTQVFVYCENLANVTIGNGVTEIGTQVFWGCKSLAAITVDSGNTKYFTENGVLYNKDKTMLIAYPAVKTGSFTIPNSVIIIGFSAFDFSRLSSVIIPNSVTSIEKQAFESCENLTSITIGNSVASIGEFAFNGCTRLTNVTIPASVASIGERAFDGCTSLISVTFQGTIITPNFRSSQGTTSPYFGELHRMFYATDKINGTPGTYTRADTSSRGWTKQ